MRNIRRKLASVHKCEKLYIWEMACNIVRLTHGSFIRSLRGIHRTSDIYMSHAILYSSLESQLCSARDSCVLRSRDTSVCLVLVTAVYLVQKAAMYLVRETSVCPEAEHPRVLDRKAHVTVARRTCGRCSRA